MSAPRPHTHAEGWDEFVRADGARLRRVLVAQHGVDVGNDACADALAWAWEHRAEVAAMANPTGYLFRVAQTAARRYRERDRSLAFPGTLPDPVAQGSDPELFQSLGALTEAQRVCVLMVHAHHWTYQEVADVLGIAVTAVTNHVHRGMARLRTELGGDA